MTDDSCDDCAAAHLKRHIDASPSAIAFSSIPLILTWLVVATISLQRLFPRLAGDAVTTGKTGGGDTLPQFKTDNGLGGSRGVAAAGTTASGATRYMSSQRIASLVFSASIGLSTVLVELLLCEISNALAPGVRSLGLHLTLSGLMVLSILVVPALEIHGFVKRFLRSSRDSATSTSTRRSSTRLQLFLEVAIFAVWLTFFWYIPQASILRASLQNSRVRPASLGDGAEQAFIEACLERIGIIGISLMASLSGFAAVSSLWQTFGVRHRLVRDTDLARKEAGLHSAREMLAVKESRLRALEHKLSDGAGTGSSSNTGFVGRMAGYIRGSKEEQELKTLRMEISGLSTMVFSLSASLTTLRARHAEQQLGRTHTGRLWRIFNIGFAVYCAWRICATSISSLRRWWAPGTTFATSDPINNFLALLTAHWDPTLDREAWSRQISFLLSGVMLLASFNAVLQTFRLFARFAPTVLQRAQTSLPLLISQIAGCYVIASALLLRSNLPREVGGVITDALGTPLEGRFVEGWFESWFLVAVCLTATGVLVGRKVGSADEDWDDLDGVEIGGKTS